MRKMLAVLLAVSLSVGLSACAPHKKAKEEVPPINVYTVAPSLGNLESYTTVVGKSVPKTSAIVKTELSEKVTKVYKKVGDYVKAGELLLELDNESTLVSLKSAEAELNSAKANAEKLKGSTIESAINSAESGNSQMKNAKKVMEANLNLIDVNLSEIRSKLREVNQGLAQFDNAISSVDALISSSPDKENTPVPPGFSLPGLDIPPTVTNLGQVKEFLISSKSPLNGAKIKLETAKDQLNESYKTLEETYNSSEKLIDEQEEISEEILETTKTDLAKELSQTADAILTVSEISYRNAQNKLKKTKVYSPIDGYIDSSSAKENNMVPEGTELFTISSRNGGKIEFNLSSKHIANLSLGTIINIETENNSITAKISEIPPMVDMETGLFKIVADVEKGAEKLTFGEEFLIKIPSSQKADVLTLPISCVYFEGGKSYVFKTQKDGDTQTAIRQEVETGIYNDRQIEIISGISKDDEIISSWSEKLIDGAKIKVVPSDENSPSNEELNNDDNAEQ